MAVNVNYGSHVRAAANSTPQAQADTRYFDNRLRNLFESVNFATADSIASTGYFGKLPSAAIIDPSSKIYFGAAGTSVTLDIGDSEDPNGLATVIDVSSAGSADLMEAVVAANKLKPLWEILGYTEDPDTMIDLYATIAGAAVVAGFDVAFCIRWSV